MAKRNFSREARLSRGEKNKKDVIFLERKRKEIYDHLLYKTCWVTFSTFLFCFV